MNARTVGLGTGSAVTTFLVAGAATIELLGAGEAPAVGLVGVFVGVAAGLLAAGIVAVYADRLSGIGASALVAYATIGVAFVGIAATSYVNVPYADDVFTFPVRVGASVAIAVIVALLDGRGRLDGRSATA